MRNITPLHGSLFKQTNDPSRNYSITVTNLFVIQLFNYCKLLTSIWIFYQSCFFKWFSTAPYRLYTLSRLLVILDDLNLGDMVILLFPSYF